MRIIMIECDADELRANRTVMDNINEALNAFTRNLCGVDNIDFTKAMAEEHDESEDNNDE